ncbi:MAG: DNA helicase RecQ [Muribaculaceae bacterium]|nr:DNA helicase RecQ [Muribaculaceae bacterium]
MIEKNTKPDKEAALAALRQYYGFSGFRPGQWDSISAILNGRDTIVLMPTGGGKSICFQLPALLSDGCCIIVSPLIALMNDQVASLRANGLPAGAVNSMKQEYDNRATYEAAMRGELKMLYISPERLLTDIGWIANAIKVSFIAVDEAHCISQWGHDFRPVYTDLIRIKETWPNIAVMALTATADRLTREDISRALGLKDPFRYIGSFDRPNISLRVVQGSTPKERVRAIIGLASKYHMDCGIVYCLSRKGTEQMTEKLREAGLRVGCYHAGLPSAEREQVQRDFVNGRLQAICATIAFGMGIDKSNVRWVVHNNIPGNIESYYQEIGRAGRDGLPAETILYYSFGDIIRRREFADQSGQKEINSSKLDFMQKYAEASVCRRRILLSYFSEDMDHDCGNCDNCRNPRAKFDGTVLAQKALSAIVRVGSSESMNVIIEILRGMTPRHIIDRKYNMLPTYGVGKDLSVQEWNSYLLQMIQLGLIEVAYEDRFHLRPTQAGKKVLKGERKVELAEYISPLYVERSSRRAHGTAEKVVDIRTPQEILTEKLKALRADLAAEEKVADYMVFSDVTIKSIVDRMPLMPIDLMGIEGLSLVKLAKYYKPILVKVRETKGMKRSLPKGISDTVSLLMFRQGLDVDTIAGIRGIAVSTVAGHLCNLFSEGEEVDLWQIVPEELYWTVCGLIDEYGPIDLDLPLEEKREKGKNLQKYLAEKYGISHDIYSKVVSMRRVLTPADQ